jgi:hypothetical protein
MRAEKARLPHIPYLPLSHIFNRGLATQRSLPTKPNPTSARERDIGALVPMPLSAKLVQLAISLVYLYLEKRLFKLVQLAVSHASLPVEKRILGAYSTHQIQRTQFLH